MTALDLLNQATTHRNLSLRRSLRARAAGDLATVAKYAALMRAWEMKARTYANTVGTRLVSMADNPTALVPEIFVSRLPR
jgi:hypothetical protein